MTECPTCGALPCDQVNNPKLSNDRLIRHAINLFEKAKSIGWQDDGEGPLEFLMHKAYVQGAEDFDERDMP